MRPKFKKLVFAFLLFVVVPAFTMGGCSYPPTAFILDVEFLIAIYSRPINNTHLDLRVTGYSTSTQYRYVVGGSSINCTDSNIYSSWRPYTSRLQADISGLPEGRAKICLLARKEDPESPSGWLIQSPLYASFYGFTIDRTPPPAPVFSNPPTSTINDNSPVVEWTASGEEVRCTLDISSSPDCNSPTQSYDLTASSQALSALTEGTHYLCLTAFDAAGNSVQASEYPRAVSIDTTPPSEFSITGPASGSNLTVELAWGASTDATAYNVTVATSSDCASGVIQQFDNLTSLAQSATVPAIGTYYVCASAKDSANNSRPASNSGYSFTVSVPQEIVVKDHLTDNTCWNTTDSALIHFNAPNEKDAIVAARFVGLGGIIKRVGGIFIDSNCTAFNSGSIQNMQASIAFYENVGVFMADPYLRSQPANSRSIRVNVPILHTNPVDPLYYLNPVRTTTAGTQEFFIESDVSALGIQTTEGQEHLVALWFSSDNTQDGATWMAFSSGCAGQVGNLTDYYVSHAASSVLGPNDLINLSATRNNAAYFVSELK